MFEFVPGPARRARPFRKARDPTRSIQDWTRSGARGPFESAREPPSLHPARIQKTQACAFTVQEFYGRCLLLEASKFVQPKFQREQPRELRGSTPDPAIRRSVGPSPPRLWSFGRSEGARHFESAGDPASYSSHFAGSTLGHFHCSHFAGSTLGTSIARTLQARRSALP